MENISINSGIWDETLYKAWSSIVYQLIPNVRKVEEQLGHLRSIMSADEVGRVLILYTTNCL